jgi:endonuclease/exonuclease/phosphatase family metal-dependent hydrolase
MTNKKLTKHSNFLIKQKKNNKKKTRRNKYKKYKKYKKNIKKGGGNITDGYFTIMTFNVEVFLNLYNYTIKDNRIITCVTENLDKINKFKNLFTHIDVACLQEVDKPSKSPYPVFKNPLETDVLPELNLVQKSICASEPLDWSKATIIYGVPSFLANAVYVSSDIETATTNENQISSFGVERCYSSVSIVINNKIINIVSVHLIGGRFDDKESIQKQDYNNEKINQIKKVVEQENPDIICGDFNTKIRNEFVKEITDNYFNNLLTEINISHDDLTHYKARWDKWIYMDDIHSYLIATGYLSVYFNEAGIFESSVTDTSAYGGIVDMIYYKKDKILLVPGSVSVVGEEVVMRKKPKSNLYTPILSDHYPVKAEFKVI